MRFGVDDDLAPAMPLDNQHAMTELTSGYAIDREVAEKSRGAQIGKSLADFRGLEAVRIFDGTP